MRDRERFGQVLGGLKNGKEKEVHVLRYTHDVLDEFWALNLDFPLLCFLSTFERTCFVISWSLSIIREFEFYILLSRLQNLHYTHDILSKHPRALQPYLEVAKVPVAGKRSP